MIGPQISLRNGQPRDIPRMVQLLTDPRVRAHLGGPKARALAWLLATVTLPLVRCGHGRWAQIITDPSTGQMLGTVLVDRRRANRPGHVREAGRELELSYVLLPDAWGHGVAAEASRQLLNRVAADVGNDEPVVVVTQSTNEKALALAARIGFQPRVQFTEFGSDQTLLTAPLAIFRA